MLLSILQTIGLVVRLVLLMNKAATMVTGIDVAGKEITDKRNSAIVAVRPCQLRSLPLSSIVTHG